MQVTAGVDGLVVTNLDRMAAAPEWRTCAAYASQAAAPELEAHFTLRDGMIQDIKLPADPTNLAWQEELTRLLFKMQPIYTHCEKDPHAYLQHISQALDLPVVMTSHGPTALEKNIFSGSFAPQPG